jgi:Polysaccharide deacetylase
MNELVVTVDIDWACEPAVEETLDYLLEQGVAPTVFSTHASQRVKQALGEMEVGLHPFFDPTSSHGNTIPETVAHVMGLPHNLKAFRCHRFAICNTSRQAMVEAGMLLSSNVCTDLEVVSPFRDRFGLLEVPVFLEDGGYLWRRHPLELSDALLVPGKKVILIHPMHFAINTPDFAYMADIKRSMERDQWRNLSRKDLDKLRWKGRGIRDLVVSLLESASSTRSLSSLLRE